MVVRLGVLELDMETVLDSDLHLDRYLTFILKFWVGELDCEVHFLDNLGVVVTLWLKFLALITRHLAGDLTLIEPKKNRIGI